MKTKSKKIFNILFIIILLSQLITKIYVDTKKEDFFIDEFYSYALMNYKSPFIFRNDDFLNQWHNNDYFKDYVVIEKENIFNLTPVYTNQIQDVHPPFYYLLLRIFTTPFAGIFSKWPGLILNLTIYIFVAIILYKIAKMIFKDEKYALLTLAAYGFSIFSMENTLYIRMYQLLELELLLLVYWHLKNIDKPLGIKNLSLLIVLNVLGVLTHYYYILFLAGIYLFFLFKYIKAKDKKSILKYTISMIISAVFVLVIFPYALSHIFSSYRGSNSLFNLTNLGSFFSNIKGYWFLINSHIFLNGILPFLIVALVLIAFSIITKKKKLHFAINKNIILILIPLSTYLILVIKTAPFIDIRYILPVLVYILLLTIYLSRFALDSILKNKKTIFIILCIAITIFTIPTFIYQDGMLYMYYGTKATLDDLKTNYGDLPCICIYTQASDMFNNFVYNYNFLLQSEQIYITEYLTPASVIEILEDVDTSKGILLYDVDYNITNRLRLLELDEFNAIELITDTYTNSIYHIYYDPSLDI